MILPFSFPEKGEITPKEFETAKASGAIVGCVAPERIPDEAVFEE